MSHEAPCVMSMTGSATWRTNVVPAFAPVSAVPTTVPSAVTTPLTKVNDRTVRVPTKSIVAIGIAIPPPGACAATGIGDSATAM